MFYNLIKYGVKDSKINFPHTDDYKRWKKQQKNQPSNWKYRNLLENPIFFNTNNMGYRTHEFDFHNDKEYIMTFGCSNTYGLYLHEDECYSNLIENKTGTKTYNLGICGGSAGIIMMNLSKFLYSNVKLPTAVVIQWPEHMRLNFPITEPYTGLYNVRASSKYGARATVFEELVKTGNIIENYSLWAKDTVYNMLKSFEIKIIDFAKDREEAEFYNVPYIQKIDKAYDDKHIGAETNKNISKFVLERL